MILLNRKFTVVSAVSHATEETTTTAVYRPSEQGGLTRDHGQGVLNFASSSQHAAHAVVVAFGCEEEKRDYR